ncbi:DNA-processing protein DprA [Ruania halotolerans]|uniref:DNA-processing protein DprA n=1 Tax=Ruania halotolerans TaxID=2897773 RepID=UPI001E35295A|nr:DNA-processing protein DprA [Ruania halotolerans]UFU05204.1 DNA-processing protein DprA [Ruania halotolerans]
MFDSTDEVLARAAWSRITEPRDRAAGVLVAARGAAGALDWVARASRPANGPAGIAPSAATQVLGLDAELTAAHWAGAVARWAPRLVDLDPRREVRVISRLGGQVLVPGDVDWPCALNDLGPEAPHCLWVRGDPGALSMDAVALVGSRASTSYGDQVAAELAAGLVDHGRAIVSGGAFGIDAAAHRATIAVGGVPVAVMAGGLDRFYPAGNAELLARVARQGVVVSEAPPGTSPMRQRFLSRNRLIAALAGSTVVVEASWRSGALSTAHHALGIGRPVAAVPGPVTSVASAGCHRLLREGADCVTDAAEVIQLVSPIGSVPDLSPEVAPGLLDDLDAEQAQVLDALPARASADVAALVRASGVAEHRIRSCLGYLELAGRVRRDGSRWRRAKA